LIELILAGLELVKEVSYGPISYPDPNGLEFPFISFVISDKLAPASTMDEELVKSKLYIEASTNNGLTETL